MFNECLSSDKDTTKRYVKFLDQNNHKSKY